jgi:hypothetical protein
MPAPQSTPQHRQIVVDTTMRLASLPGHQPVAACLQFATRDPFAVSVVFAPAGNSPVVWVFARDLLVDGVRRPTGVGDVHLFPLDDSVVIDLRSPDGSARLIADAAVMTTFVDDMLALVPAGCETRYVDLEAELAAICKESFAD